jgi:hypothetical protein
MKIRPILFALALAPLVTGCASVVEGTTQPISIATNPEIGATCTVSNAKGQWSVVTPGTITVKKSATTILTIHCSKPGWEDGIAYAAGKWSKAGIAGEIVPYVGLVNYAADMSSGAMMVYPNSITVPMRPALPQPPPVSPPASKQRR